MRSARIPESPSKNPQDYPLLRYMGSKYKLLDWIRDELGTLSFDSVLDGFSGSGAVSYMFKSLGKQVYSNDFLNFSYTLAKATVENRKVLLGESDLEGLFAENKSFPDFIQKTFKGIFYTPEDLRFLDNFSFNMGKMDDPYKRALAMSALIRSCLKKQPRGVFTISGDLSRYNDGRRDLRLSFEEHVREQIQVYNGIIFDSGRENRAFHGDVFDFDLDRFPVDLVYLDPPYVPRSDDNCYVKRYHFVEGLSKYWKDETIKYDTKVHKIEKKYTPFSYRRTAVDAFEGLFEKFRESIIVLSYSSNGYPDLNTLVDLMGKHKRSVSVKMKEHKYHFGNHKSVKRSHVEEYLIIGQ
ncbi:MAG: DNA adenine methylase [Spirochaetales bacterium]|nr:DNA adenine methylase [Spirochaetales bacterium]